MNRMLFLLCMIGAVSSASAMLKAVNSYVIESKDGTSLFVVRALKNGGPFPGDRAAGQFELPDGRTVDMSATFPLTGASDAETFEPLWTLDGYIDSADLAASPDLSSIAVVNRYAADAGGIALQFYHGGMTGKAYRIPDLVKAFGSAPFLERTRMLGMPLDWLGRFDAKANTLHLSTAPRCYTLGYREDYRFDMTTGEMLSKEIRAPWGVLLIPLFVLAGVAVWIFMRYRKNRRMST